MDSRFFVNIINKRLSEFNYELSFQQRLSIENTYEKLELLGKGTAQHSLNNTFGEDIIIFAKNCINGDPTWIECQKLNEKSNNSLLFLNTEYNSKFLDHFDFECISEECNDISGVYSFWKGETCLYVGKSKNLGQRILTSYASRIKGENDVDFIKVFYTKSECDAGILELYAIGKFKPLLNKIDNSKDKTYVFEELEEKLKSCDFESLNYGVLPPDIEG